MTALFVLLVFPQPKHNIGIWFITYPANTNALVSFAVSGIYLSFLLAVIASIVARARGWVPEGSFRLGRWGWPVSIVALAYLGLMFINVAFPSGLDSGRALLNLDWITLAVIAVIAIVGAIYFVIGRPDRALGANTRAELTEERLERV